MCDKEYRAQNRELDFYYYNYVIPVIKEINQYGLLCNFLHYYNWKLTDPIVYYIKQELKKYIKNNYNTNKYNIIIEYHDSSCGRSYILINVKLKTIELLKKKLKINY